MPENIGITVEDALNLEALKRVEVVAGYKGIDSIIKSVNVMEVPDILDWVKQGEFLLTTIYSIKDDEEALNNLIPRLAENNLAGLGVKPGRYIEEIPQVMIEQANKFDFPLLELPYEVSFSELIESILLTILDKQANFLKHSLNMHENLMEVALEGGGLSKIADTLADLITYPVAIVDSKFKVLAFSQTNSEELTLEDITENDLEEQTSHYLNKELIKEDELVGRFKRTRVEINGKERCQMSIPIVGGEDQKGHIFVWEGEKELRKVDLIAIERSSTVAALEIVNQQAIFEVERKYQNELLYDLISGGFESKETIIERGHSIGWNLDKAYALLLFDLTASQSSSNDNQKEFQELKSRLLTELDAYFKSNHSEVILGDRGSNVVLLYPVQEYLDEDLAEEKIEDKVLDFAQQLVKVIEKLVEDEVIIGVGNYYQEVEKLQDAYDEAKTALKVAEVINRDSNVIFFGDLGVYKLLYNLNSKEINSFLQDTILPLLKYDEQHNTEFVETLQQYFLCNGNLKKMADNLYLHYNSVLYRIERIQEIMDLDLDDREDRLNLEIGLKLLNFNES